MIKEENLLKIGQFTKPHGIKGEISLVTNYDISDIPSGFFIVCNMDGIWVPFFVEACRSKSSSATLVSFEGIRSEAQVKTLAGKAAYIPIDLLPSQEADDFQWIQTTGYTVTDETAGVVGIISNIDDSTLNILLHVSQNEIEILIPAALATAIDSKRKIIEVSLPEGFFEI